MKRALPALALLLALAMPAWAQESAPATGHSGHAGMDHGADAAMSPASDAYMEAMARMDRAMTAMPMTGRPGPDFAAMMIPHHQAAIDMAEAYLASGDTDPELAKLAGEVIEAQRAEIAVLHDWLKRDGGQ